MSARVGAIAMALLLALGSPEARAGARIGEPRQPNPRFDTGDSTRVRRSELGLTFGTPAGFNLEAGWWPDPIFGGRVSGLYLGPGWLGVQGAACVTISRGRRSRLALVLAAGETRSYDESFRYLGPGVAVNAGPLFFENGVAWSSGDLFSVRRNHPVLYLQVGLLGGGGILGPRAPAAAPSDKSSSQP